jgi:uncharacterized protein
MRMAGVLAACVAIAFSTAACAQTLQPTQVDPQKLQLAKELIEVSGSLRNAELMVRTQYAMMGKVVERALPPERAAMAVAFQASLQKEVIAILPEVMSITTEVYARNLTTQELREYLAWIKSDTGQAILAKFPAIVQQASEAQQPLVEAMFPKIMKRAVDAACDQSRCTPSERQKVTEAITAAIRKPKG